MVITFLLIYLCVYICYAICVEIWGQVMVFGSLLPLYESQWSNSGPQGWWQMPLSAEFWRRYSSSSELKSVSGLFSNSSFVVIVDWNSFWWQFYGEKLKLCLWFYALNSKRQCSVVESKSQISLLWELCSNLFSPPWTSFSRLS